MPSLREIHLRHARHYAKVLARASIMSLRSGDKIHDAISMLDQEWINIQAGQEWVGKEAKKNDRKAASILVKYTRNSTTLLSLRQTEPERIRWMKDLLYIAQRYGWRRSESFALNGLGVIYEEMDERIRAIELYKMTLIIARDTKNRGLEARTLGNLGWAYIRTDEDIECGIEYCNEALIVAREVRDTDLIGRLFNYIGAGWLALEDHDTALEYFNRAMEIANQKGDLQLAATTLHNIGRLYHQAGNEEGAVQLYLQVLSLATELGDLNLQGKTLGFLSELQTVPNSVGQTPEDFERMITSARARGNRHFEADVMLSQARGYRRSGRNDLAAVLYNQVLGIAREINNYRIEGFALSGLLAIESQIGHRIELGQQLLNVAKVTKDRALEVATQELLGAAYLESGHLKTAILFNEQAKHSGRRSRDPRTEGWFLSNSAASYLDSGQPEHALELCQQALDIARKIEDRYLETRALKLLGAAHRDLGYIKSAIVLCEQALKLSQELGDRLAEGYMLTNLGVTYLKAGQTKRAIQSHKRALEIACQIKDRALEGHAFYRLGDAQRDAGNITDTVWCYKQALAIYQELGGHNSEGWMLLKLSSVLRLSGKTNEAVIYAQRAIEYFEKIGESQLALNARQLLAVDSDEFEQ